MIRKNQKGLNRLNALSDGVLVFLCYFLAAWLWLDVVKGDENIASIENLSGGLGIAAVSYALWAVLLLAGFGLYRSTRMRQAVRELCNVVIANTLALLTAAAALYLFRLEEFSRGVLGSFYVLTCVGLTAKRLALWHVLGRMRAKGYNLKNILVIGGGRLAQRYIETVKQDEELGIRVAGQLRKPEGLLSLLEARLHDSGVDEVVIALEPTELGSLMELIQVCEKCGTKMSVIPFYNDVIPAQPRIDTVGQLKLFQLRSTPMDEPANALIKRGFDIVVSAGLLVVLSPLLLVIAIATRLSSPGPILFKQERIGLNKKPFMMYKFRSMRVNDEENTAWSGASDDRRTWVGSFLRKTSLDELPQLFNTLKGDMSLVGPRPEIPYYVEQFRETVPLYMVKYQVRPGMTGWAQIHGLRGDTSIPDRVEHDLWYIDNWSFGLDLLILARTAFGGMVNDEKLSGGKAKCEKNDEDPSASRR